MDYQRMKEAIQRIKDAAIELNAIELATFGALTKEGGTYAQAGNFGAPTIKEDSENLTAGATVNYFILDDSGVTELATVNVK